LEALHRTAAGFAAANAPSKNQTPLDELTNQFILSKRQRVPITFERFIGAAEPTQNIGAGEVEWCVLVQTACALDVFK
jgi:hypothetical protein